MAISLVQLELALERILHPRARQSLAELWSWWRASPDASRLAGLADVESRWRRWVAPELGQVLAGELTAYQVELALQRLERAGRSAVTANHVISDLRRVVRAARAADLWPGRDPLELVRRREVLHVQREVLTLEEARKLLRRSRGRHRLIWALALNLGLRKGEVLALERGDVDLEHLVLLVRRSHGRGCTKNGRWRALPILPGLARVLIPWVQAMPTQSSALLFPGRSRTGRMAVDVALSKRLRCALRKLNISKRLRFHDLRHTFASLADEAGIAEEVISAVLGHRPSVTGRYTHRSIARLRQERKRLKL